MAQLTEVASDFMPLFSSSSSIMSPRSGSPPTTPGRRSPYSETTRVRSQRRQRRAPALQRVMVHVRGSIFGVLNTYVFWIKLVVFYFFALLVLLYTAVIEPPTAKISQIDDNWWDHLHALSVHFNFLAIMLLMVHVFVVIKHWWEMRLALACVHEGVLAVAGAAASFMPSLESMDTRKTLVRYAHAIHELLWRGDFEQSGGEGGSSFGRSGSGGVGGGGGSGSGNASGGEEDELGEDIVNLGFLSQPEMLTLRGDAQPAVIIVHWMTSIVLRARNQNLLVGSADAALTQFLAAFNDLRKGSLAVQTLSRTNHAHPVTQLVSVVVFFALALFAMEMGQDAGSEQVQGHEIWMAFDAAMILIMHLLYHGVMELAVLLANPFEPGITQLPRAMFRDQLNRTTRSLVRLAAVLPGD